MNHQARPCCGFGSFLLDPSEQLLLRDGRPVSLTPKVFDLLCVLVENRGHLVEKDQLLKKLWPDSFVEEANLNRCVSVLRKALGDHAGEQRYIETVPKRGYRFVAPVSECVLGAGLREQGLQAPSVRPEARLVFGRPTAAMMTIAVVGIAALSVLLFRIAGGTAPRRAAATAIAPLHRQVTFTGNEGSVSLSPNGRRIAYVSSTSPDRTIVVRELGEGQPIEVFKGGGAGFMRWSPHGDGLLFWGSTVSTAGVFVAPQPGSAPRLIARDKFVACWSPDGSTIAVASYLVGKIAFLDALGQEQRTLALQGVHSWVWDMDWSSQTGQLLLVSNDDEGKFSIWTVHPDGRGQQAVLEDRAEIASARWAPGGDAIYYFRRENQTVSLNKLLLRPDGRPTETSKITLLTGLETDRTFGLSADGRRLVYARAPYHSNLWLLDLGKSGEMQPPERRELTRSTSLIERPRVSPDGNSILFNIGHARPANLYTMPIDGGVPRPLTKLDSFNVGGAWSPDGKQIAFASTHSGTPHVWTIDADGGVPRVLSSTQMSDSFDLAWAPGSQILYQAMGNRNYVELDPETRTERPLPRESSDGWMFSPVRSPDGRSIAVSWNRRPARGIWVIDTRTARESLVYPYSADIMPIGWSSDGRSVYAVVGKAHTYRGPILPRGETITEATILMIPIQGGAAQTIATLPGEIGSLSMAPDGRRFVYTLHWSRSDIWVVDDFDVTAETAVARR